MTMVALKVVSKTMHNAMRCFDKHLWAWQSKAVKKLITLICANWTTVLQKLYNKDSWITANKFRESLSNHLWKIDLEPIIHEKVQKLISKTNKYNGYNLLAWDASDIFKPHAKVMQWIRKVRDWSTWLIWNWYVIYWLNINWITHQVDIKDPEKEYIWAEKREEMLLKSAEIVKPEETIWIFDRWHDDVWFIDMLQELWYHFVVRWRKNRKATLIEGDEEYEVKVWTLVCWKYEVRLEVWVYSYLYVVKWSWKNPILLYSDVDFVTWEECLEIYKKRRKIEMDYSKMKWLWLEDVRLMSMKKIVNIMRIIQFIIMLWQDVYNEIAKWVNTIPMKLAIIYKEYCRKTRKKMNPSSLIGFFSEHISEYKPQKRSKIPISTLFWSRAVMKKVGLC